MFPAFDDLRHTVNRLMSDFDSNLRGQNIGGRRRGGGRRGRGGIGGGDMFDDMDMLMDVPQFGSFGPIMEWGDEDVFGPSGFPQLGARGGQPIGLGGKGGDEIKQAETGGQQVGGALQAQQQQKGAQQTTSLTHAQPQQGTAVGTFQPLQTLRARVNVEDLPDKFVVTAECPGFDKQNLKVNVSDDGLLSIRGEQSQEWVDKSKEKNYLRAERTFANIQRTLRLPKSADLSKIQAAYENGVLHLDVPKKEGSEAQKSITIG